MIGFESVARQQAAVSATRRGQHPHAGDAIRASAAVGQGPRRPRWIPRNQVIECKKTAVYGANMYYSGPPLEAARRLTVRTNYRS